MSKLLLITLLPFCLHGSLIVTGDLPSRLASVSIIIPDNPANQSVPLIQQYDQQTWTGEWTVDGDQGQTGPGVFVFNVTLFGESFGGGAGGEYMDDWSNLASPTHLSCTGYLPQGCSATYSSFSLPFVFGQTETLTLTSDVYVSYLSDSTRAGSKAYLSGQTLTAWVAVYPGYVLGDSGGGYRVHFAPEPGTGRLMTIFLVILAAWWIRGLLFDLWVILLSVIASGRIDYLPDAHRPWVVDWRGRSKVGRGKTFWEAVRGAL